MKLAPRDAAGFLSRPDPRVPAILIWGADPMRVAERRQRLVAAVIGPAGDAEMRLTRFPAADLRKDPAIALDAIKAQGFFPGPRAVLAEEATEGLSDAFKAALAAWSEGDAMLVVTAGQLAASSKLRKLFEGHRSALALAVYDDPPGRDEIEAMLRAGGLTDLPPDTMRDLVALAQTIEPGDLRQTIARIALYKLDDPSPLSPAEVALLAPQSGETAVDDAINAVCEGRAGEVAPLIGRLAAQGVQPVGLCIGALRHFRALHALASDPRGASTAIAAMRPPVFGTRRDRMLRQARLWPLDRAETALSELVATDLKLRSSAPVPQAALIERALIRLATLAARAR